MAGALYALLGERRVTDAEEQAFAELATRLQSAVARRDERVASATAEAEQALGAIEDELTPPAS